MLSLCSTIDNGDKLYYSIFYCLLKWTLTCTSVCSINATDCDSDGKCSSSVVVFNLIPATH